MPCLLQQRQPLIEIILGDLQAQLQDRPRSQDLPRWAAGAQRLPKSLDSLQAGRQQLRVGPPEALPGELPQRIRKLSRCLPAAQRTHRHPASGGRLLSRPARQQQNNIEVAAALFVSRKTVEAHLPRVYRKLGIRSRTQLARILLVNGIAD
jgi:hypothetical protein